jgi:hypothetical protein
MSLSAQRPLDEARQLAQRGGRSTYYSVTEGNDDFDGDVTSQENPR